MFKCETTCSQKVKSTGGSVSWWYASSHHQHQKNLDDNFDKSDPFLTILENCKDSKVTFF